MRHAFPPRATWGTQAEVFAECDDVVAPSRPAAMTAAGLVDGLVGRCSGDHVVWRLRLVTRGSKHALARSRRLFISLACPLVATACAVLPKRDGTGWVRHASIWTHIRN